jgi:hypothetical protein
VVIVASIDTTFRGRTIRKADNDYLFDQPLTHTEWSAEA